MGEKRPKTRQRQPLVIIVHVAFALVITFCTCLAIVLVRLLELPGGEWHKKKTVAGVRKWMGMVSAGFGCGRNRLHVCQGAGAASTLAQAPVPLGPQWPTLGVETHVFEPLPHFAKLDEMARHTHGSAKCLAHAPRKGRQTFCPCRCVRNDFSVHIDACCVQFFFT